MWTINPEHLMGTEIFLSIDRDFHPLEKILGRAPGKLSGHPQAFACGQLDVLEIRGDTATIIDAKTGYSSVSITEEEAAIYSCLVFAHYSRVQSVEFWWDFVRIGAHKKSEYDRGEMPELRAKVESLVAKRAWIEAKHAMHEELDANPWAGLCPFCRLLCPIVAAVERRNNVDLVPLQSIAQAKSMAAAVYICESFLDKARPVVKAFIQAREDLPNGQLALGGDYVAENTTSTGQELPISEVLHALGLGTIDLKLLPEAVGVLVLEQEPAASPEFDIPLKSLNVSSSSIKPFMKTKRSKAGVSREGLRDAMNAISKPTSRSTLLKFRKVTQDAAVEAITEGGEQE